MAEAQIITNQYVKIEHTPAGVGERIFARILDYIVMATYLIGLYYLLDNIDWKPFKGTYGVAVFFALLIPVVFYSFLWEIMNRGHSPGKVIFGMRVVMRDGTTPTVGAYFMRWLLLLIDTWGWIGVVVILLNNNNQRLGDLAAGTIVIKEKNYHRIQVSLDEFNYLSRGYQPVFP
ncbi:MAG: RDD family protein, partial [Tannerella sp.]|nr:RDD family protein [Tannerella sp.]